MKQYELNIYTRYLVGVRKSTHTYTAFSRKFKKYVREETIKKGKNKAKGYETWRKGLTRQSRHVSMPLEKEEGGGRRVFTACGLTNPLPFLHLLSHSLFLAQTSEFFYPCPSYVLFVHFYTPLPIRARFIRRGEHSPRISNRPEPVSSPLL